MSTIIGIYRFFSRNKISLPGIQIGGEAHGISLGQLRGKGRARDLGWGRKVMTLVAKEYGYKGQEIAGYLFRDPSVIT